MTHFPSIAWKTKPRQRPAYRPQPEALEGRQLLSAGDLDPSFGLAGYVMQSPRVETSKSHASDYGYALQIQADGSILAAGQSGYIGGAHDFGMIRLTPAGTLDTTFGSGGRVVTDFSNNVDEIRDLAIQADGRIIAVGLAVMYAPSHGRTPVYYNGDFGVARYLPNGTLDPAFGPNGNGKVNINVSTYTTSDGSNQSDEARAVAIQADGKIVVGGLTRVTAGGVDASLVRLDASGKLDPTFGQGGKLVTPIGVGDDVIRAITILPDGKILTVGYTTDANGFRSIFIARYGANGNLDPTFGPSGTGVTIAPYATSVFGKDMALGSDGSIFVTGDNSDNGSAVSDLVLAKLTPSGTLDTTFGASGFVAVDRGGSEVSRAIEIQPDGKIVLAGHVKTASSTDALLVRLLADGTLDPSFGNGGVTIRSFSNTTGAYFENLVLQPDGQVVAVGTARSTDSTYDDDILVARFLGDPAALQVTSAAPAPVRQVLTAAQARPALSQALAYWRSRGADTSRLGHIELMIADLGGARLGEASGTTITLDNNAAGWGWDVGRSRKATDRMDLLSALAHEVGHLLGHDHAEGSVMAESLAPGARRLLADRVAVALPAPPRLTIGAFRSRDRRPRVAARS